jgi:hypothetical protein
MLSALAAPAGAQELPHGTWTGTMTPPGGQPLSVAYEVGLVDGALVVAMRSVLVQEVIRFQDVRLEGDELTFWWEPGVRVDCTLRRTETGSYEGTCAEPGGPAGTARMTMVPPV